MLIDQLKLIQSEHGFLPRERLLDLSRRESIPLYQIEAVASFYPHFRASPPPAVEIAVCADMSCYLAGGERLEEEIRREVEARLGIAAQPARKSVNAPPAADGGGTPRIEFKTVSCLGLCDRAPACALTDHPHGDMTIQKVRRFLDDEVARSAEQTEDVEGDGRGGGTRTRDVERDGYETGRPASEHVAGAGPRPEASPPRPMLDADGGSESARRGGARIAGSAGRHPAARLAQAGHAVVVPEPGEHVAGTAERQIDPYGRGERYGALRELLRSGDRDSVIPKLKESGLRGLGGAGFPTGTKWDFTRRAEAEPKYVVCNADESEPGTFKDREVLERFPHLVLEGMLIGAYVVGARRATLFLRHEYEVARERVAEAIAELAALGLAGENILGSGFSCEVELFVSAGGYICGEETALLEAMEGKRAEPRNKPPFPGLVGFDGKPTLMNNVETFAMVPVILSRGPGWFRSLGENGGSGLKYFALSGHVNRPGVYEAWLGIPARRFILEQGGGMSGGRELKAFAPGGASSGFLPAALADLPLDFKPLAEAGSMLGTGAVVAVGEGTCMLALALNVVRFFRNESCGKCVPCREGTEELVRILDRIRSGRGEARDLELIDELSDTMAMTSICGLGQAAPLPITSVIRHWRAEVDAHILDRKCPEGVCS